MPLFTNIIGYTATVIGTCLMLPQIIKSWKTRSVGDLSLGMVILYFFNCLLWLTYGVLIGAMPVIIANGVGLVISIVQVVLKVRYR